MVDEEALADGLSAEVKRARGAYFTPEAVVAQTLDAVARVIPPGRSLAFVDPACGAGAFLAAVAQRWPEAALVGVEVEAQSAAVCRARVPRANIVLGDALGSTALDDALSALAPDVFVVWVGNPPYNGTSALLKDAALWARACAWLPEGFALPKGTSLRDDYAFFLLRARAWLTRRPGALAFVTSSTWLDAFLYAPVRAAMCSALTLHEVRDLGGGVFRGTRVRTCITVWSTTQAKTAPLFHGAEGVHALEPSSPEWALRPASGEAQALDEAWRADGLELTTLVPVSFAGLKTRFDELLVDASREVLCARVAAFLSATDVKVFAQEHRLPERVWPKLRALFEVSRGLRFDPACVRGFIRARGRAPLDAPAWCYVERALIPRGDHRLQGQYDPHALDVKLVFNVNELPLAAVVVATPGCVTAYQHARFAPLMVPRRAREDGASVLKTLSALERADLVPNLSPALSVAGVGAREVFEAIARFVGSAPVQQVWAPAFGTRRVLPVPRSALSPTG